MSDIPLIISVDDHVVEPPNLWTDRLPSKYGDRIPHMERRKVAFGGDGKGGAGTMGWHESDDGVWADFWHYDELVTPFSMLSAAVGFKETGFFLATYDDIIPGCLDQTQRLKDMDSSHVQAAVQFPNTLPRFAGQTFSEQADKELGFLCIQAYNDWVVDEWGGGPGHGRLLPLTIVPFWDPELAAGEIRRCADKGSHAIAFPENPHPLGFPSIHDKDRYWEPVFQAAQDTETVICMHIGSSSKMPSTSPDAPFIISSTLTFQNAMGSLCDYIFSGTLERFPTLTIAYSEGQVGWMPYILERADKLWEERSDNSFGSWLKNPPSSYIPGRVYGCIFDDDTGLRNRDAVGMTQICFETDYPHADSNFPHSKETLEKMCARNGLNDEEIYLFARGNAIKAFGLERWGITE